MSDHRRECSLERLQDSFDGCLEEPEASGVRAHVQTCVTCQAQLAAWQSLRDLLAPSRAAAGRGEVIRKWAFEAPLRARHRSRRAMWLQVGSVAAALVINLLLWKSLVAPSAQSFTTWDWLTLRSSSARHQWVATQVPLPEEQYWTALGGKESTRP